MPTLALTFDDGPDPGVTPRVLDVLGAAGARATFFPIAARVRAHPGLIAQMVAEGARDRSSLSRARPIFAAFDRLGAVRHRSRARAAGPAWPAPDAVANTLGRQGGVVGHGRAGKRASDHRLDRRHPRLAGRRRRRDASRHPRATADRARS